VTSAKAVNVGIDFASMAMILEIVPPATSS
jgi:hypothetical protein